LLRATQPSLEFDLVRVIVELGKAKHALNLGKEMLQLPSEVRMLLARLNEMQELFSNQIFQRAGQPKMASDITRRFALTDPLPMKLYRRHFIWESLEVTIYNPMVNIR
jgi:hypothetical protein